MFRSISVRWLSSVRTKQNKTNKQPSFTNKCWSVGKRSEVVRLGNEVVVFGIVQGQTVQKDYAKSIVQGQPSLKDICKISHIWFGRLFGQQMVGCNGKIFPIVVLFSCPSFSIVLTKYSQSWNNAHVQASPLC